MRSFIGMKLLELKCSYVELTVVYIPKIVNGAVLVIYMAVV
uniref:Uncharacterized protein n=1 Tax=Arundo donax TaxID=35708 RepID=A0A0A9C3J3_ARUDO